MSRPQNQRTLGKEHPDTLNSVNNLAALLRGRGDYDNAEPLYRRALEARERTLGKEHMCDSCSQWMFHRCATLAGKIHIPFLFQS